MFRNLPITLAACGLFVASAHAWDYQVTTNGNVIVVSITGMDNRSGQTCAGASVDLPGGGANCGQPGATYATITRECNRLGAHTVFVDVSDATTNGYETRQTTVTVTDPPPVSCSIFQFNVPASMVLTRKYGDEPYPPYQSRDFQADVLFKPIQIDAGATVYAKVLDPRDPSSYRSSVSGPDDNIDRNAGTLSESPYDVGSQTLTFAAGSAPVKKLYLNTTPYAAGDNYVVRMSTDPRLLSDPNFVCTGAAGCQETFPVTAWKRVYLEKKKMFRSGVFVADAAPAGQRKVLIQIPRYASWRQVRIDAGSTIRLLHAPRLDGSDFFASDFHQENAVVTRVERVPGAKNQRTLTLADPLRYSYDVDRSVANALEIGISDGVGNLVTGVFDRNESYLRPGVDGAYVDFWPVTQALNEIPYAPVVQDYHRLANKWFENTTVNLVDSSRPGKPNVKHVLTGTGLALGNEPSALSTEEWGRTGIETPIRSEVSPNYSWTWVAAIEAAVSERNSNPALNVYGLDPWVINGENLVHELAHSFNVNSLSHYAGDFGHCSKTMANTLSKGCTMRSHEDPAYDRKQKGDGIVGFHWDGDFESEYMTLRRCTEPIPIPRM